MILINIVTWLCAKRLCAYLRTTAYFLSLHTSVPLFNVFILFMSPYRLSSRFFPFLLCPQNHSFLFLLLPPSPHFLLSSFFQPLTPSSFSPSLPPSISPSISPSLPSHPLSLYLFLHLPPPPPLSLFLSPSLPQSLLWLEDRRLILSSDEAPLVMTNPSRYKASPKYYLFEDVFAVLQVRLKMCICVCVSEQMCFYVYGLVSVCVFLSV